MKIYRLVSTDRAGEPGYLVKFRVFLKDRPGSLAAFSSLIASCGGNIGIFHYDRSLDSSRVVAEVQMKRRADADGLLLKLAEKKYSFEKPSAGKEEVAVTAPENVLEIKVRLVNEPGTLAALAGLLKRHRANVLYMLYDDDIDPESADIALATKSPEEIDGLLDALNGKGYHYRVVYRGSDSETVENIIGLKAVEKFFLRLTKLLGEKDVGEVKRLVDSSQELYGDLVKFYSEAGNNLESADVFEKVLSLASMSRGRVGARFSVKEMPELNLSDDVRLLGFRLPTSENIYVLDNAGELTLIDTGFGIYYEDIKKLLLARSLDPSHVRRIFVTHADADHAGTSGYFADEFGAEVYMHPGSKGVIDNCNRAFGVEGSRGNLNRYYTRLINAFTECRFPRDIKYFSTKAKGRLGGFGIIDTFDVGGLQFLVLESRGGHIPGHVFFVERKRGLVFSSDYLINVASLSLDERGSLGVYRYLLTNPNSDSDVFRAEMADLKALMRTLDKELKKAGAQALILPGHGDYYTAAGLAG